jgi:hypothetical protein
MGAAQQRQDWRRRAGRPPLMSGKPPVNRPAEGDAFGFELSLIERAALLRIRAAGHVGVTIGDDLPVSVAIRLALLGHVRITRETPQRLIPIHRAIGARP